MQSGKRHEGTAFVIGGSGGLGSAACVALAKDWTHILIGYSRNAGAAEQVAEQVRSTGTAADTIAVDVNSEESITAAVNRAEVLGERLAALVYSAGIAKTFDFVSKTPQSEWVRALNQDVLGLTNVVRCSIDALRRSKGAIVAVTTYQAGKIEARGSLSAVPKAAVDRLVAVIAKEEGRYGVRANAVRTGWIDAGSGGRLLQDDAVRARKIQEIPLGRVGRAEEFGAAVAFLCSPEAAFITGTTLTVDGGESL